VLSIFLMQPVPPAGTESTQMQPLNLTVLSNDSPIRMLIGHGNGASGFLQTIVMLLSLCKLKIRSKKEMKRPALILQIDDKAVDTKAEGVWEM